MWYVDSYGGKLSKVHFKRGIQIRFQIYPKVLYPRIPVQITRELLIRVYN